MSDATSLRAGAVGAALCCGSFSVLLRLVLLLAPPPDLWFQGAPWVEEWLRGNIAHEVLQGQLLPLHSHQIPCWGGMLWMGLLAVPGFLVFGETLFALRLSTLPFAFLLAACGFLLLDRVVSRRAAWIGGLLLAFTPPGWTFTSITAQGTHLELATLSVLLLWLWAEDRARNGGHKGWSFASGLALGAHASFGWGLAMVLVPLWDWLRDRRFFLRACMLPRAAGLLLGLLPLASYQLEYGDALRFYERDLVDSLTPEHATAPLQKLLELVTRDFADSFWFADPGPGAARCAGAALATLLCIAWLRVAWTRRRELEAIMRGCLPWCPPQTDVGAVSLLLAFPALYLPLYLTTPFGLGLREWLVDYRYLLVPQAFLLLVAAIAADELMSRRRWQLAVPAMVATVCLGCTASALVRCQWSRAGDMWSVRGSRPESVPSRLLWKHGADVERIEEFLRRVAERRTPVQQEAIYYELARYLRIMAIARQRRPTVVRTDSDPLVALRRASLLVPAPWNSYFVIGQSGVQELPTRPWDVGERSVR